MVILVIVHSFQKLFDFRGVEARLLFLYNLFVSSGFEPTKLINAFLTYFVIE